MRKCTEIQTQQQQTAQLILQLWCFIMLLWQHADVSPLQRHCDVVGQGSPTPGLEGRSTNSEGQVQMLSQPWYSCPPEPSILLWSLKTIYKNLWVTKFLVCFWSRPFGVALIWFWIKLKQLELLSTSAVTQNWKKDGLKTVDAKLITNRLNQLHTPSILKKKTIIENVESFLSM